MSSPEGSFPGWVRALCRLALRACPAALRDRHGEEMWELVEHRWQRLRGERWARLRILAYVGRDVRRTLVRRWRGAAPFASLAQDVRFGARAMRRAPAFTATAVLTLALGIGANAAIFSVVNAVLLTPLPYPEPERIYRVMPQRWHSARQVDALREQASAFAALTGVGQSSFTLHEDTPERIAASLVWPEYFRVLGIQAALGRTLREEDTRPGAEPVVILSDALWRTRFGGDPEVLGRSIPLEGENGPTATVVGVLPPGDDPFPWPTQALAPVRLEVGTHPYSDNFRYWIIGRIADGMSAEQVEAQLRGIVERLSSAEDPTFSRDAAGRTEIVSFRQDRVRDARESLVLMLAAVGVVLLIACVNVANLLLARSGARRNEVAVRSALGAGRGRLVRQLLTESVLLALVGGGAGLLLAFAGVRPLAAVLPTAIPRQADVRVDGAVLVFALLASLTAGLVFGIMPALRVGRVDGALHGARGVAGRGANSRLHRVLLAGEVGLAVVLLLAAGLLTKSLWGLYRVDPGFDPRNLVAFQLGPSSDRYADAEARAGYYRRVLERVRAVPGVVEAGAISMLPVSSGIMGVGISPDGNPVPEGDDPTICSYRTVTPGAFAALGMRIREGRALTAEDGSGSQAVGVVNQSLAKMLWPGQSALGNQVFWGTAEPWFTVVGVVDDVHQGSLAEPPTPEAYVSYAQQGTWLTSLYVVVRHEPGAEVLAAARAAAWEVDPDVLVTGQGSLDDQVRASMAGERGWAVVFGSFAALALVLASVGVFGVTSYLVAQRRHEVGVRLALGARRADVVAAVLRLGMLPVAVGLVAGVAAALLGGRLLEGLLHDVRPGDPTVLAGVVAFLAVVALAANAIPALRASNVDPVRTLRAE